MILGGSWHCRPHLSAEDPGTQRGSVVSPGHTASERLGDQNRLRRLGGRGTGMPTFACGISPAPSSQARLGVLPSPQGTVPFRSPRQVGRERAQPRRKSPAPPGKAAQLLQEGWLPQRERPPTKFPGGPADRQGFSAVGAQSALRRHCLPAPRAEPAAAPE